MKKYIATGTIFIATLFLPLASIYAQGPTNSPTIIKFQNPIKSQSVAEVLLKFFEILVQLGAVAVTLAIVYAGFLFVAARGNPGELTKAKTTLFWTIIGAMILLGAQVLAKIIENTISKL